MGMGFSQAIGVAGTVIAAGNGATPEEFTVIAEVIDISGPEVKSSLIQCTTTQSPDFEEEFIPGQKSTGMVKLSMNLVPQDPGMLQFQSDRTNRVKRNYLITASDTELSTYSFAAFVDTISPDFKMGSKADVSVSLQPTGGVRTGIGGAFVPYS